MRLVVAAAAALITASCAREQPQPVQIGQPAPRYSATTLSGDSASIAGLAGKVVLLNIWATWCHPCRDEIPYLETLYETHRGDGFEIVGVSVDARGQDREIRDFVKEFRMTYPIWHDPDERVQSTFLALGVPASYLIDRQGVLRWRRIGVIRATDTTLTRALTDALAAR
jgi:cytochrome c-type biogenesis protein